MFIGVARLYGPESFGQFTLAHTYLSTFYLLADFGFEAFLTREIARDRLRVIESVQALMPLKFIFSVLAMLTMCMVALAWHFPPSVQGMMVAFSISILASAGSAFFFAMFKGLEEFHQEARISLLQNVMLLVFLIIAGTLAFQVQTIVWIFVATRFLGFFIVLHKARRVFRPVNFSVSFAGLKSVISKELPFAVFLLCGTLYFQLDTLLLGYMTNEEVVGVYQAVFKLIAFALVSIDVLVQAMFPMLSRLNVESARKWTVAVRFLGKTLVFLGMLFGFPMLLYPKEVLFMVYGKDGYDASIPILRVFALIFIVRSAGEVYALMLTTGNNQLSRTYIVVALTVINLVMNLLMIPRFGAFGAALVSLATNVLGSGLYIWAALRHAVRVPAVVDARLIISIAVGCVSAMALRILGIHSLSVGGSLLLIVLCLVFITVGYTPNERRLAFSFSRYHI
jgi:O-antigen/teichoic acid export membrane protein